MRGRIWFAVLFSLLWVLVASPAAAAEQESKFLYSTMSWSRDTSYVSATKYRFLVQVEVALDQLAYGSPTIGSVLSDVVTLDYVIGGQAQSTVVPVTAVMTNVAEHWFAATGQAELIVPITALPLTLTFSDCCRVEDLAGGNAERPFSLAMTLPAGSTPTQSPRSMALPRIYVEQFDALTFQIPATTVNGAANHFSFATTAASGLAAANPAGMTLDGATGKLSWTPPAQGLYALQVIVQSDAGPAVPVDFVIDVLEPAVGQGEVTFEEGFCGGEYTAYWGHEISIDVTASSDMPGDMVEIVPSPLPDGAELGVQSLGASSTSVLSWTPFRPYYASTLSTAPVGGVAVCFEGQGLARTSMGHCCITLNLAPEELRSLSGVVRDFPGSHPDFDVVNGDASALIVADQLGVDHKPVFNSSAGATTIASAASFASWWDGVPGINNARYLALQLGNGASEDPGVFGYDSSHFYPVDSLPSEDQDHNRFFTFEGHTTMVYEPGALLRFESTDDLWVFVNGRKAVDLGGVHGLETFVLSLDNVAASHGLAVGESYAVDVFYAHRGDHAPALRLELLREPETETLPDSAVSTDELAFSRSAHATSQGTLELTSFHDPLPSAIWMTEPIAVQDGFRVGFDVRANSVLVEPADDPRDEPKVTTVLPDGLALVLADAPGQGADDGLGYHGLVRSIAVELDYIASAQHFDPLEAHLAVHTGYESASNASTVTTLGLTTQSLNHCDDPIACFPITCADNFWRRLEVEYVVSPGASQGWLRIYYNLDPAQPSLVPTLEVPIPQEKVAAMFPNGVAFVGITAGATMVEVKRSEQLSRVQVAPGVFVDPIREVTTNVADIELRNWSVSRPEPTFSLTAGAACSSGEQCVSGACAGGVCCAATCDGPCLTCALPDHLGECMPRPDGSACSDHTACTGGDVCQAGACVTNSQADCGEASICNSIACNAGTGQCDSAELPEKTPCPNQDVCQNNRCTWGACELFPNGSSSLCRPAAGECDVAESCSPGLPYCPTDKFLTSTVTCQTAFCTGGDLLPAVQCSGTGPDCPDSVEVSCAPYVCGNDACRTSCTSSSDCSLSALCDAGVCRADTAWPVVTLAPLPAFTNQAAQTVRATIVEDGRIGSADLSVNGTFFGGQIRPNSLGEVEVPVTLEQGENLILLRVNDSAGHKTSASATVVLDTTPPSVQFTSPQANQALGTLDIDVSLTVADDNGATVTVNGGPELSAPAPSAVVSTTVVAGQAGQFELVAEASDAAGNHTTVTRTLLVDLDAPVVTVDVLDGAFVGPLAGDVLPLLITVDDQAATVVTLGTSSFSLPRGGGAIDTAVALSPGVNVFTVEATSETGSHAAFTRTVVYDVTPPNGSFAIPAADSWNRGTIELSLETSDDLTGINAVTFELDDGDGPDAALATGGTYVALLDTTTLADGAHDLVAVLVDGAGNEQLVETTLLVDNMSPLVSVSAPGTHLRGVVELTASATDASAGLASVELFANGALVASCPSSPCVGSFDTATLSDGPFVVQARAVDRAGNDADSAPLTVTAVNSVPSSFLTSPLPGSVITGTSLSIAVAAPATYFKRGECFFDDVSVVTSTTPTFSRSFSLAQTLDGPSKVECFVQDLTNNVISESAAISIRRWAFDLKPNKIKVSAHGGGWVTMEASGPQVSALRNVALADLGLAVPGGSPVPASSVSGSSTVTVTFERARVAAALQAGIASQQIDPALPVPVSLLAGSRVVGEQPLTVRE